MKQALWAIFGVLSTVCVFFGAVRAQTLSTFGTPGLIDMPTAEVLEQDEVALTTSYASPTLKNTFTFQFLPRVYGSFRYSWINNLVPTSTLFDSDVFDRSFDVHYQFLDEKRDGYGFGLAVGLRDFAGTGIYGSEYIVATKTFRERLKVTAGIGWGRLAQRGSFSNPLGALGDSFDTRPDRFANPSGQFDTDNWFRGPAAFFGGIEYQYNDRLSFQLEYSSDAYAQEASVNTIDVESPFNVGMTYAFKNGSSVKAFLIAGSEFGLQYSYVFNPRNRPVPGGLDRAPVPLVPRDQALLAGYDLDEPDNRSQAEITLSRLLADEGMDLQGFAVNGRRVTIEVVNNRWSNEAQAVGRAARALAIAMPAQYETFQIVFQTRGMPISAVTLARSDLEELETDYDGAWRSLSRADIADAPQTGAYRLPDAFPRFTYGVGPYTAFSFFDPDAPVRIDVGPEFFFGYTFSPGLTFGGVFRYPLISTIDDSSVPSDSVLPRVRTDALLYAQQSDLEMNQLYLEYLFRPGQNLFGRVTGGYLEDMYGGVSAELLWYPVESRLALGAEVNWAKQRDFDMGFGFQDYDIVTGHASAYYDLGNGFTTQVDVGRYLAGDWGATFSLDREFNNGFKIGGYFTLTEVSSEDFGEGSFDKGFRVEIPVSWLTGRPTRDTIAQTIQPVLRDGGARLKVPNRLYGVTRDYRAEGLSSDWGRVFR